ncbi:MAG TPA: prolyl oligopeptidase family serine peptidase [Candidatus Dormibacteraeota bacterium]|nr:prolyl oligopeptidase family serine peptidase [Candidatus Dormibacteraeota bacterium]
MSSGHFDVERLLAMPRVAAVATSHDGRRIVTTVSTVAPDQKRFRTSLWELDVDGTGPPRRLTRSAHGESLVGFLPDGGLLFTASRPDPDSLPGAGSETDGPNGLWLLPAGGGDPVPVALPPGGVDTVAIARDAGVVACFVPAFPDAPDWDADRRIGEERRDQGVAALLYDSYPIRWWDHYVGPRRRRIAIGTWAVDAPEPRLDLRDLTPDAGDALEECDLAIAPDGRTIVTTWRGARWYSHLVAIDVATGARRTLVAADGMHLSDPACSPDGRRVAYLAERVGGARQPIRVGLWVVDLEGGGPVELLPGSPLWPGAPHWTADSAAVVVAADEDARRPVWRVEASGAGAGGPTRLADGAEFTDLAVAPGRMFAVRSTPVEAHHVVALDTSGADQSPRPLTCPRGSAELTTRTEEVWIDSPDGRGRAQGWLTVPAGASAAEPAPLVVLIHGGPFSSFAGWHWRWNAHVLADRGYAVLSANPALSTGFGWENIDRAWDRWGELVQPDLEALLDAACTRADVDGSRVAAAGGSFGGYMANWLAGHSGRFRCLVTHASLWALDQFHGTTDVGTWMEDEFGDPDSEHDAWVANSPRTALAALVRARTPMLLVHGELDARVPVSEALRLWTDLRRNDVPSRFLYFPDENHWVLKPQNVRLWYATVLAFLDEHLRGLPFAKPDLL